MANLKVQKLDFTRLDQLSQFSASEFPVPLILLFVAVPILFVLTFKTIFVLGIFVVILASIGWGFIQYRRIDQKNHETLAQFASANGFQYAPEFSNSFSDDPGTLFTHGHSKKAGQILSGALMGFPFTLFRYDYTTGSGKSQRSYDANIMEISLPRTLPHMIIDSLVEDGNGSFSTLPIQFDKKQKIELEGDFNKYFALYAPDTYGISALTIIAPDAMDALMRHAALCDIEIIDNKLYFYWPKVAIKSKDYQDMFDTAQEVLKEIGDKLSRGDIFAHAAQAQVHSSEAVTGVRLKKQNIKLASVLTFLFYVTIQVLVRVDGLPVLAYPGFVLILMSGLVYVAKRQLKRKKLLKELQDRYQNFQESKAVN